MRWLVVGALGVETRPLIWRLDQVTRLSPWLQVGIHPEDAVIQLAVLRCGVGPAKAQASTTEALRLWRPDAVLSIGTCGALVDSLQIGDIRTIGRLFRDTQEVSSLCPVQGLETAALTTVDKPCWTTDHRKELADAGAEMVEMEAAAVAEATLDFDASLPVHAIKIVSDQAGAEPDPVIGSGLVKNPLRVVRFKFRALRLSHDLLVPRLLAALAGQR